MDMHINLEIFEGEVLLTHQRNSKKTAYLTLIANRSRLWSFACTFTSVLVMRQL
jgi:hypothetical protein